MNERIINLANKRLLMKDIMGEVIEDIPEMFKRVAGYLSSNEEEEESFFDLMNDNLFLPNSPCLTNAGVPQRLNQLSACFVLDIEDSINDIYDTIKETAIIHKSGGGTGFDFSKLRPANSAVASTGGVASGPVSFMRVFDASTEGIKQGGCLTPETLIFTSNGLLRLDEIVKQESGWEEHDLHVPTDNGTKVSPRSYNNGFATVMTIQTSAGLSLTGTLAHGSKVMSDEGLVWKPFKELTTNDWIGVKLNEYTGTIQTLEVPPKLDIHLNQNIPIFPEVIDEEFAFFLGYFTGNGYSASGESDYRLGVSVPHKSYLMTAMPNDIRNLFNLGNTIYQKEDDKSCTFTITNKLLKEFFKLNGLEKTTSLSACVPAKIRMSPRSVVCAYLQGLFEADGTLIHGYPQLSTTSHRLAKEVCALLIGIGCPTRITKLAKTKDSYGTAQVYGVKVISSVGLDAWTDNITFNSLSRFAAQTTIDLKREQNYILPNPKFWLTELLENTKQDKPLRKQLLRYLSGGRNLTISTYKQLAIKYPEYVKDVNNIWFTKVESTTLEVEKKLTLDLEVEDNHTYLAYGLITHNTRRGANMGVLRIDHPDIEEFISCKSDNVSMQNFNISVAITNNFMRALIERRDYDLIDPATNLVTTTKSAKSIFDLLIHNAWLTGDPGVLFIDRINENNPLVGKHNEIAATNPCGEQPLAPYEACGLGSINLSPMVSSTGVFDYDKLRQVTIRSVLFLHRMIHKSEYPNEKIAKRVVASSKIGLGHMGFADALIKMKLPYTSEDAINFAAKIAQTIIDSCVVATHQIGQIEGAFPLFEEYKIPKHIKHALQREGIPPDTYSPANAALTTIAPTGSISILADCSSGIEPVFYLEQVENRADAVIYHRNPLYAAWVEKNPDKIKPTYFQDLHDIDYETHIAIQSIFQRFICSGVSKTVNLPNTATKETVGQIIHEAYHTGCKGTTIYRDGSKSNQVITDAKNTGSNEKITPAERPETLSGKTYQIKTGYGDMLVTINSISDEPFEVICQLGKSGASEMAKAEAIGKLTSMLLRCSVDIEQIIKQLEGIVGGSQILSKHGMISSIPDAVAKIMRIHMNSIGDKEIPAMMKCPECESKNLQAEGSCICCKDCGWKSCS